MIRAAASIADKALNENRAVGMTVNAGRMAYLPADRGGRQHQKVMQLLAAVDADSSTPLVETLIASVGRLRRGMTAVVITASTDAAWIRPLASLRTRGIGCVVVLADSARYAAYGAAIRAEATGGEVTRSGGRRDSGEAASRDSTRSRSTKSRRTRSSRTGPSGDPHLMTSRDNRDLLDSLETDGWFTVGLVLLVSRDARVVAGRRAAGPRPRPADRLPLLGGDRRCRLRPDRTLVGGPAGRPTPSARSSPRCCCRSSSAGR